MGAEIGNILISYDIDKSHTQVKAALELLGYLDRFKKKNDPKTYILPNTTLLHLKKSSNQAMDDIKTTCNRMNVKLEKAVAVKATEFVGF